MRATLRGCIAAAYLLFFGVSALGTEPAQLREPGQLWLQGVEQVGADDIRRALVHDFDVALASHPDASLSRYLRAVEASILLGYRHSGFRDATVGARYDEEQERIVVSVNEGDRHVCGQIKSDGAQHADTDALIRA